jgi:hypothetical protein
MIGEFAVQLEGGGSVTNFGTIYGSHFGVTTYGNNVTSVLVTNFGTVSGTDGGVNTEEGGRSAILARSPASELV